MCPHSDRDQVFYGPSNWSWKRPASLRSTLLSTLRSTHVQLSSLATPGPNRQSESGSASGRPRDERIEMLSGREPGSPLLNDEPLLNEESVMDDNSIDLLFGDEGEDWFADGEAF